MPDMPLLSRGSPVVRLFIQHNICSFICLFLAFWHPIGLNHRTEPFKYFLELLGALIGYFYSHAHVITFFLSIIRLQRANALPRKDSYSSFWKANVLDVRFVLETRFYKGALHTFYSILFNNLLHHFPSNPSISECIP